MNPHQDELPMTALMSHSIWPGRVLLYVHEVATALRSSSEHVWNLIDSGQLRAIDISTQKELIPGQIDKRRRPCFRIPVAAWDHFIKESVK